MRFDFETMRAHYGESIGSYRNRTVYVKSKYDDLSNGVYCLFDFGNALVIDGTLMGSLQEDGQICKRDKAVPWRREAPPLRTSPGDLDVADSKNIESANIDEILYNAMKAPLKISPSCNGYITADDLLKSAYNGSYGELYSEV